MNINNFKIISLLRSHKNLILFTGLKLINALIGLFINMFIVRKITVEEFGTYSIILTVVGFLTTFGFSWSSSAIIYYGARERIKEGNMSKTFWSRNYILLVNFSIVITIFLLLGRQIEGYIGLKINNLLLIWLVIKIGIDSLNTYFLATKQQISSAMVFLIGRIIFIFSVFVFNYGLKELVIINLLCDFIGLAYLFKIDKKIIGKPTFDKENFKEVLNFGLWQLFGFSGLYLINFGDNFVIRHFLTLKDVGIYNSAYKLFNSIAGLSALFSSYYGSQVVEALESNNKKELKKIFYQDRIFLTIMLLIPHIFVIVFSEKIIAIIYGSSYLDAALILKVLMVGSFFRFATTFNKLVYNSLKKHKILQFLNMIQMIINLSLDIILIKKFGILGAAIGTTVAIVVTSIVKTIWVEKKLKSYVRWNDYGDD